MKSCGIIWGDCLVRASEQDQQRNIRKKKCEGCEYFDIEYECLRSCMSKCIKDEINRGSNK
jgi:hypothetical protein